MSWANLVKAQVANGFDILGDLVLTVTWVSRSSPVFLDGEYSYSEASSSVEGVMSSYNSRYIDGKTIQIYDQELIVRQDEVENIGPNDQFVANGTTYNVVNFSQDPAGATWVVQLRAA